MGKIKQFFADFKVFAAKGNVIDMAVGVIIGGAFGKIVTSLVTDIITPLISLAIGKNDLSSLAWVIKEGTVNEAGEVVGKVALTYGNFVQTIIDFLIIAFSIFLVLRIIMNAKKKLEDLKKKPEPEPEEEEEKEPEDTELSLLKEIRDMMKNSNDNE